MDAPADARAAWTPPLARGDLAPWFTAPTPTNSTFSFSTVVGRYVLLGFAPPPGPARDAAFAAFQAHRSLFDDAKLTAFVVLTDEASMQKARNQPPGLRWFFDPEGKVSRLYGALDAAGVAHPHWLLLDPMLRVLGAAPMEAGAGFMAGLADLPPVDQYAGAELVAPVLIVPRVFDHDLCRRLIGVYEAAGGAPSGVMRNEGGRTVGVLNDFKRRRDAYIEDEALRGEVFRRLKRALFPEVKRVFQWEPTWIERYLIACYDAEEGGYFRPHRDNETPGTMHRKFACSINLNAEDFEGGDLRFPEFGRRTYRPPTGGAVVFACSLQHEATHVTRGRRYAYLPFLYDDAGAEVREANRGTIVNPDDVETDDAVAEG
jgi:predicted 2-oxoglutarate/Fe(II)-dependent dioxygenase YbiX/peroxiredoxin